VSCVPRAFPVRLEGTGVSLSPFARGQQAAVPELSPSPAAVGCDPVLAGVGVSVGMIQIYTSNLTRLAENANQQGLSYIHKSCPILKLINFM
jgi:hypothetical protein